MLCHIFENCLKFHLSVFMQFCETFTSQGEFSNIIPCVIPYCSHIHTITKYANLEIYIETPPIGRRLNLEA